MYLIRNEIEFVIVPKVAEKPEPHLTHDEILSALIKLIVVIYDFHPSNMYKIHMRSAVAACDRLRDRNAKATSRNQNERK